MSEVKTIRFIDSHYNLLFTVPDGGNVKLTFADGETVIRQCHFIDDCHTKIGSSTLHICEFAENMERNGTTYAPELPVTLPELCYSILPASGELVVIKSGAVGHFSCAYHTDNPGYNRHQMKHLNERLQVTPQQQAAMEAGSCFGWDVPAANPNHYDVHGKPLPKMTIAKTAMPPQHIPAPKKKRTRSDLER